MSERRSDICTWCDQPAMGKIVGPSGDDLPICPDHFIKIQSVKNEQERINAEQARNCMALANQAAAEIESLMGRQLSPQIQIPGPAPANLVNAITLHNSTVGVISTAAVQQISASVAHMDRDDTSRAAIEQLTAAVTSASDLASGDRDALLEQLAVVAAQAAAPRERRSKAIVLPMLEAIGKGATAVTSLANLWAAAEPLLKGHFGI